MAPTIHNPACQEQLDKAARMTLADLNTLMQSAGVRLKNTITNITWAVQPIVMVVVELFISFIFRPIAEMRTYYKI